MELTPSDTLKDLRSLILDAIPGFEFPRQVLTYKLDSEILDYNDYPEWGKINSDETQDNNYYQQMDKYWAEIGFEGVVAPSEPIAIDTSHFNSTLTDEEQNIIAILMVCAWLQRQITSIENVRMKYSGSDFKFTSQANHLSKLLSLLNEMHRQSHHMQRLYKRRKVDSQGQIRSNWSVLREVSTFDY